MIPERRTQFRLPVAWKANLVRLNGEQIPGSTDNVTLGGVNVIVDHALQVGEPVHLDVTSCVGGETCWHRLHGLVVYSRQLPGNLGFSIGMVLRHCPDDFARQVMLLEQTLIEGHYGRKLA